MSGDGFLASTPMDQWPDWAKDLGATGVIVREGRETYVDNGQFRTRCKPGDYIVNRDTPYPVVVSGAVYEGRMR